MSDPALRDRCGAAVLKAWGAEGESNVDVIAAAYESADAVVALLAASLADDEALVELVAAAAWRGTVSGRTPPHWAGFETVDSVAQDVFRNIARSVLQAIHGRLAAEAGITVDTHTEETP